LHELNIAGRLLNRVAALQRRTLRRAQLLPVGRIDEDESAVAIGQQNLRLVCREHGGAKRVTLARKFAQLPAGRTIEQPGRTIARRCENAAAVA
jgi:hypothetical protein